MEIQLKKIVTYMMHKIGKENYQPRKKKNNQKKFKQRSSKIVESNNLHCGIGAGNLQGMHK